MKVFLETSRLTLREFTEDDAADLFALDGDPEVMRFIGPYALGDVEAYRERIRTLNIPYYASHPGFGVWAAVEKAGGAFLGWFILRHGLDCRFAAEAGFRSGDVELGYRLRKTVWGMGYATEGSLALVDQAFKDPAVSAVVATVLNGNVASIRVMEKAGLRRVGEFPLPGYDQPSVKYALDRDEYHSCAAQTAGDHRRSQR